MRSTSISVCLSVCLSRCVCLDLICGVVKEFSSGALWSLCRASNKNTSHGNEVLPQESTHLIQRPCYLRGSLCQDPAGNRTTRRPGHRKETQSKVVWAYLLFVRSCQNHLARHSERGKKTGQTDWKEIGKQHQGMDRPVVCQVPVSYTHLTLPTTAEV